MKHVLFLIAIFAPGIVQAERLCLANPTSSTYSGTTWKVGTGCANNSCAATIASGISKCSDLAAPNDELSNLQNSASGRFCFCKMTSPKTGLWVFNAGYNGGESTCVEKCASDCGNYIRTWDNGAFRAAVFATSN